MRWETKDADVRKHYRSRPALWKFHRTQSIKATDSPTKINPNEFESNVGIAWTPVPALRRPSRGRLAHTEQKVFHSQQKPAVVRTEYGIRKGFINVREGSEKPWSVDSAEWTVNGGQ